MTLMTQKGWYVVKLQLIIIIMHLLIFESSGSIHMHIWFQKIKKCITHFKCMHTSQAQNLRLWPICPSSAFSVAEMSGLKRPWPKCPWLKCRSTVPSPSGPLPCLFKQWPLGQKGAASGGSCFILDDYNAKAILAFHIYLKLLYLNFSLWGMVVQRL